MRSCLIVIVNYRTKDLVLDCLRSLEPEMRAEPGCRVVVVDNASPDDSVSILSRSIQEKGWTWASVLAMPTNGGFAYGNNAAIRPALADESVQYFHLLNPDTLVEPGAVAKLLDFMERHPEVGIAGSQLLGLDGSRQCSAFRFHSIPSEFERGVRLGIVSKLLGRQLVAPPPTDRTQKADWVSGASMMVRREVFERIGLLDEEYFLYYEETDFELRATRAGWTIWQVAESRVVHLEGASTGVTGSDRARKRVPRYWFESRRRYFRKHHGRAYEFLANLAYASGNGFWRILRRVRRQPECDPPQMWRDFVRFNFSI